MNVSSGFNSYPPHAAASQNINVVVLSLNNLVGDNIISLVPCRC
jgi:hypothetical protein